MSRCCGGLLRHVCTPSFSSHFVFIHAVSHHHQFILFHAVSRHHHDQLSSSTRADQFSSSTRAGGVDAYAQRMS